MDKVYGLFYNHGDGIQVMWDFGVYTDEEQAYDEWVGYLDHGYYIDEIKINK